TTTFSDELMAKYNVPKSLYCCQECGSQQPKWMGRCPDCGKWGSLVEEAAPSASSDRLDRGSMFRMRKVEPVAYAQIESQNESRQPSGIAEFDQVLGGGIVPGSLVLIGGDPGIGKSTLLLQVSNELVRVGGKVLYISGEESERQIKLRG